MRKNAFPPIALGALVIVLGFVGVITVNVIGEALLKSIFPNDMSEAGLPLSLAAQISYQVMLFIAGMVGAWLIVNFARGSAWIHVWIFGVLALFIDMSIGMTKFTDVPSWFRIVMIASIPLQLWTGAKIGFYFKRSTAKGEVNS